MKPICPRCYSSYVYPVSPTRLSFPQSLEPNLLSPAVLAGIGASLCRQHNLSPTLGMIAGSTVGIALTYLSEHTQPTYRIEDEHSYYCRSCNQVFDDKPIHQDEACPF